MYYNISLKVIEVERNKLIKAWQAHMDIRVGYEPLANQQKMCLSESCEVETRIYNVTH